LRRQLLAQEPGDEWTPARVVRHLGAVQAQDYYGSLWSVGQRSDPATTKSDVERAIADRLIVRTWPMRGTLHLLPAEDVRWMLALLAPSVIARAAKRHADLGLTDETFERAQVLFAEALFGGRRITRPEAMALLEEDGIDTTGQRGYHVLWTLAQRAVLCLGPMQGRQQTFVLLDEWVPRTRESERGSGRPFARLAANYLEGHGPATVADFAWWAGITKTEARGGIEEASDRVARVAVAGTDYWMPTNVAAGLASAEPAGTSGRPAPVVHLLPTYDEYMLGYTDRSAQLGEYAEVYRDSLGPNGIYSPSLMVDGRIAGTWRRALDGKRARITMRPFRPLRRAETRAVETAVARYGRFLGAEAAIEPQA
jgi:hypothetical protein